MHAPARRGPLRLLAALAATALGLGLLPAALPPAAADDRGAAATPVVTGWLPYWTTSDSVATYLANADLFTEVSPFWHTVTWDSKTERTTIGAYPLPTARSTLVAQLQAGGHPVVPSVTDGTPARRMAKVLADPAQRAVHVQQLVDLVLTNGYDGVDLDYEGFAFRDGRSTWAATRPNWVQFMTELAAALHAQGKILTTAVPPPCDTVPVCGPLEGYWVYDVAAIAAVADRVRIMAYDFSYSVPGPIGPIWWGRAIAEYAASVADPSHIQLGVPTYGRNWVRRDVGDVDGDGLVQEYLLTGTCPTRGSSAGRLEKAAYDQITRMSSPNAAEIPSLRARYGDPVVTADARSGEKWFRYNTTETWTDDDGSTGRCTAFREVWFNDADAVLARLPLVSELKLGGVAFWTVGGEDPAQWDRIRSFARALAPASTTVRVRATPKVVFGGPAQVSAQVESAGSPVGSAPATLQWRAAGSRTWVTVGTGQTGTDGSVAFEPVPTGNGTWRVRVPGTDGRLPGDSGAAATTRVQAAVDARLPVPTAKVGTRFRLYGKVSPVSVRAGVRVQRTSGGGWRTVAGVTADARGLLAVSLPAGSTPGTSTYRLVTTGTTAVSPGYSVSLRLQVSR